MTALYEWRFYEPARCPPPPGVHITIISVREDVRYVPFRPKRRDSESGMGGGVLTKRRGATPGEECLYYQQR